MRNIDTRLVAFAAFAFVACSSPARDSNSHADQLSETTIVGFPATSRLALETGGRTGIRVAFHGTPPTIEVRTSGSDTVELSEWRVPTVRWSERDSRGVMHWVLTLDSESRGNPTRHAELRATASGITEITWSIAPFEGEHQPASTRTEIGGSRSALRADLSAIGVVSRARWRAATAACSTPEATKNRFAIHHTDGATLGDAEARMRSIQQFHMLTRGWCDIGYHFLVAYDGRVFEGRELDSVGAHVGAENPNNVGISFIGCFDPDPRRCAPEFAPSRPSDISLESAANVVRVITREYGFRASRANTLGHREHAGATTACPGDTLISLIPAILSQADGALLDAGVDSGAREAGVDASSRDARPGANLDASLDPTPDAARAADVRTADVRNPDARTADVNRVDAHRRDAQADTSVTDAPSVRSMDVPSLRFATRARNSNLASPVDARGQADEVSADAATAIGGGDTVPDPRAIGNSGGCSVRDTSAGDTARPVPVSFAILAIGLALLRVRHVGRIRRSRDRG